MEDLEEARRRRLQELQRQQEAAARAQDTAAAEAQEAAIEALLQKILEPEARERLTRIRLSRPDLADQVVAQLAALARGGRLKGRLTDDQLRNLLAQLSGPDRDFKITRR